MPSIKISNLGPIKECEMQIENFTVLTGCQASGKSTIAKAIYFCRTVKDEFLDEILKLKYSQSKFDIVFSITKRLSWKFQQIFGVSIIENPNLELIYQYNTDTFLEIKSKSENQKEISKNKTFSVMFSHDIIKYLYSISKDETSFEYESNFKNEIKLQLNQLFNDEYDSIFIPAGRSVITLLTSQLNYIFAAMDDEQKRSIDYCTQKYIEYILKIKPLFSNGFNGFMKFDYFADEVGKISAFNKQIYDYIKITDKMMNMINQVLKGTYVFDNGEEKLYHNSGQYIKINFASSGQQETVWLFNVLFYLMSNHSKAFIIVEEPEAHLYPDAQKVTSEILGLMSNCECQLFITTHSPYVLGALNNLIYAEYIARQADKSEKVDKVVDKFIRIKYNIAYKVDNGTIESCIEDTPEKLIINEVIDGASDNINALYDKLFDIDHNTMDGD